MYTLIYCPLAIFTFGHLIREVILLNLEHGQIQEVIKVLYACSMLFNVGTNLIPIFDIYDMYKVKLRETKLKFLVNDKMV